MSLTGKKFRKKAKNGKWVTYTIFDTELTALGLMLYAKPRLGDGIQVRESELVSKVESGEVELLLK